MDQDRIEQLEAQVEMQKLLLALKVDAAAAAGNLVLPAAVRRSFVGVVSALELLAERVAAIEGRAVR